MSFYRTCNVSGVSWLLRFGSCLVLSSIVAHWELGPCGGESAFYVMLSCPLSPGYTDALPSILAAPGPPGNLWQKENTMQGQNELGDSWGIWAGLAARS